MAGLASVLYPPPTDSGLEEWAFAHLQHHKAIITAIQEKHNVTIPLYQIYPPPTSPDNASGWLEQHQLQHNEQNGILGIQGADLSSIDLNDKKQRDSFYWLQYVEHQSAAQILGLGT